MVISGHKGKAKVGFQSAVQFADWTLTTDEVLGVRATVVGAVQEIDKYWVTQPITKVGFWMGESWWVWSEVELVSIDSNVMFRVTGNPETREQF